MSEAHIEEQEEEVVQPAPPSVGERLRAAREARGMAVADVAAVLKLSPRQIHALEAGDWSALPGNAFIRGFVRNYARAVELDAEALLADLEAPVIQPPRLDLPQNIAAVMPPTGQAQKRDYAAVLAGLVLVAVAIVAYFVVPPDFWRSVANEPTAATEAAREPVAVPVVVQPIAGEPAQAAAPGTPDATVAPAAAAGDALPSAAAAPAAPATPLPVSTAESQPAAAPLAAAVAASPAPSAQALRFRFEQPSWVEVRDRSGQIIHSELNAAGSELAVEGRPPFALVVGNASHVALSYKGRAVELQPRSKDDVARFTVE